MKKGSGPGELKSTLSSEIPSDLPKTKEECKKWIFYLDGEELSTEACLQIVNDQDVRRSFETMVNHANNNLPLY